jgi:hypothetical protein
MSAEFVMRIVNCPSCKRVNCTSFDGRIVACRACRQRAELSPATVTFLQRAKELWPGTEVVLRQAQRMQEKIKERDEYLKRRGDFDIITAAIEGAIDDDADATGWPTLHVGQRV